LDVSPLSDAASSIEQQRHHPRLDSVSPYQGVRDLKSRMFAYLRAVFFPAFAPDGLAGLTTPFVTASIGSGLA
jgi:hypothetical protein